MYVTFHCFLFLLQIHDIDFVNPMSTLSTPHCNPSRIHMYTSTQSMKRSTLVNKICNYLYDEAKSVTDECRNLFCNLKFFSVEVNDLDVQKFLSILVIYFRLVCSRWTGSTHCVWITTKAPRSKSWTVWINVTDLLMYFLHSWATS